jgi:hypothetical protein
MLVHIIADHLRRERTYVAHVHREPYQAVVDLCFAGRLAGRLLGEEVRVSTTHVQTDDGARVKVVIELGGAAAGD